MRITTTIPAPLRRGALAAGIGLLALTGCGSPSNATPPAAGSGDGGTSNTTVSVREVAGHPGVLTTADGKTLYISDQESGAVLCKSTDCTEIWMPLTVPAGASPTAPDQLSGRLDTVTRPDGSTQVSIDRKPLYTFSLDHGPGQLGGDGQQDAFDGTSFSWRVAVEGGSPAPTPSTTTAAGDNGYGY